MDRKRLIKYLLIAASVLVLLLAWYHGRYYFWIEALFLIEIFVITFFTRSAASSRSSLLFVTSVALAAGGTAVFFSLLRVIKLPMGSVFMSGFIIGPAEEVLKIAPVILAAYWIARKFKQEMNLSDWLWVSALAGGAFSMMEKMFWKGIRFPFTYGPHIGDWYFFPDALGIYTDSGEFGYVGHAAATAVIGVGIGAGLMLRKRGGAARKFWWAIPAAISFWIILEHALVNSYFADNSGNWGFLGGGQITPYLCLIIILIVVVIDARHLMSTLKKHKKLSDNLRGGLRFALKGVKEKNWQTLTVIGNITRYLRTLNTISWQRAAKSDAKQVNTQDND